MLRQQIDSILPFSWVLGKAGRFGKKDPQESVTSPAGLLVFLFRHFGNELLKSDLSAFGFQFCLDIVCFIFGSAGF